jgi:ABC-2 type transport system permease protein
VSGFWPIFKREMLALFVTPLAWVLLTAFLMVQGIHVFILMSQFATSTDLGDGGPVQAFFGKTILLYLPMLFICPLLTMRLFAEERRSGTVEALLTAPVGSLGVTLAKYAAALCTYAFMWAPTALYIVIIGKTGDVDWRAVGASYLGVLSVGAGYLAIGTMTSALTTSQLTAAVLSAMAVIFLFMLGIGEFVTDSGAMHDVCAYVSVWSQMNDFSQGIIDLRRLVLDGSLVAVPLYITVRAVDSRRWG